MDEYSLFEESTKKYLKKAMEIYAHLEKKRPLKLETLDGTLICPLGDQSNVILSLFMSALITDGDLKEILKQYPEFNVDEIFKMIKINEHEIEPLQESLLDEFYEKHFKVLLCDMHNFVTVLEPDLIFEEVTPEVIFSFFSEPIVQETYSFFNTLSKIYKPFLNGETFGTHPSFIEIEKKVSPLRISIEEAERINDKLNASLESITQQFVKKSNPEPEHGPEENQDPEIESIGQDKQLWDKLDLLLKKFIGQETAAEFLFYNIVNNQRLSLNDGVMEGERAVIFLDGPSGTGKTAITRDITLILDIPFSATSSTSYAAEGYVGGSLTDILKELYIKAKGNLAKAERGIVVLDEFDKLALDSLEMKKAVQQQLLDFMGGGKYIIEVEKGRRVQFDTSKLTFICLGALTDLRIEKNTKHSPIGFDSTIQLDDFEGDNYRITPQDLWHMGLEKELVGRFNTYIHTEEYSRDDLLRILKESELSPLKGLRRWMSVNGKKLEIEDGVCEKIAEEAYNLNTGARGLQTVIGSIRTYFMKQVFRGTESVIYLDCETLENIINGTTNRKGRR